MSVTRITPQHLERTSAGRLGWSPDKLVEVARDVRRDILTMLAHAGSGHTGGSLSVTDFLTALLFHEVDVDPVHPDWPDRDFWNVSNAHVSPVIYSVMAERGYFSLNMLLGFRSFAGALQGHPSAQDTPGLEVSAGSLGQGLSVAVGVALAAKMDDHPRRVWCCMGDGEQQEGAIWEAAMCAAHYRLDNLCGIVDVNGLQIDGATAEVMNVEPLADKYRAFGWDVVDIDGHDMASILGAFEKARGAKGKPTVILARTVMGKGWPEIEGDHRWHGRPPTVEQAEQALRGLGTTYDNWLSRLGENGSPS
ncbi:MAG: transketolase [bacterium]